MRPVRRRPHLVSLTSFSLAWGLLVFMLVLPFTVSAANVTYETVRVGPGQYAPSGVTSPITVNVKGPGVSKFHQIVPVATPSTVGKLARGLVRGGGVGFAITGAIEGLGYLVDQATGDIKKKEITYGEPTGSYVPGINGSSGDTWCRSNPPSHYDTRTYFVSVSSSSSSCSGYNFKFHAWDCPVSHPVGYSNNWNLRGRCYPANSTQPPSETIIDLDQSDYQRIDNKLNTALSLAEKTAILKHYLNQLAPSGSASTDNYPISISSSNAQLQQLYSDWPELRQALQALVNAALAEQLALSDPEFSPSTDEQTIIDNSFDAPPLSPDLSLDFQLPAFCEWASWLCEPFVGGDQPDVPMLDLEVPEYDSGLPTGGTCPQPYMFNTGFTGPMEISFQPACDLASAIRTPLIAISYLMAGFIVVGVRR